MATAAREKQFTGYHMLAWLFAFFGVLVSVNLTLAYFATSISSPSIMKDLGDKPGVEEELPEVPDIPTGDMGGID